MYVVSAFLFTLPATIDISAKCMMASLSTWVSETALDTYLLPSNDVELKNVEYFVSIPAPSNTHDYLGYLVDLPHSVFVSCPNSPNKVKLV